MVSIVGLIAAGRRTYDAGRTAPIEM